MSAIISVEQFNNDEDLKLSTEAGQLLQKTYPGYMWGTRVVARKMIQICLGEYIPFGGSNQGMVINPKDWDTPDQFRLLVKTLGGELLERGGLSRKKSQGMGVSKRPEGFLERFDHSHRTQRIKIR